MTCLKQRHGPSDSQFVQSPPDRRMHIVGHVTNAHKLRKKLSQGRAWPLHCHASLDHRSNNTSKPKVVGLGSVGLDYLAQVTQFPKPDEKLRTEKMEVFEEGK